MKRYFFVVILFLLPSFAFAQPKITISKTKFNPGEQFTVEYSGGPALPASWIGVIPSNVPHGNDGTNGGSSISSQYTPQASGSAPFDAPPNPGSYDLRWSDGSEKELTSVTFEVIGVDYKAVLRPSKTSVNPGDEIELEYSVAIPLPKGAWIGLIPSSTPHGDENTNDQFDVAYFYANKLSDRLKFTAPEAPGSYDFRLNDTDDNGKEIASVTFQVGSVKMEGTMKLNKESFTPGEEIVLEFTAPEALPKTAWIGILPSNIPHGKEDVNDQHDIQWAYLEKKASGTLRFAAPEKAGSYDFRMNSGDAPGALEITSVPFSVSGSLNSEAMAKAIEEQGKITLYGILFDFNKDTIKPESEPVLKEVGALLTGQPDLKLRIQGHTDSAGKPSYNLDLSKKRAESVKNYLVQNFQVDAGRLTTEGFGDTKPISKNDTEEGRARNRRVELAKQ